MPEPAFEVDVELVRGTAVESRHRVALAVVDAAGQVVSAHGDVERPVPPRSAAKPFQALPLVAEDAADAWAVGAAELALACGSHTGEPRHVAAVDAWLGRLGWDAAALRCGPQRPLDQRSADARVAAGAPDSALPNMCSGKHAGFLTLARHLAVEPARYPTFDDAVQRRVRAALEALTDAGDLTRAPRGTDGCGVPTLALPLRALALGMARLGRPETAPPAWRAACARVGAAMAAWPGNVGGTGHWDTRVIAHTDGRVLVKGGAEGVVAGTLAGTGLGFAVKASDGAARAARVVAAHALVGLGALDDAGAVARDLTAPAIPTRAGGAAARLRCPTPPSLHTAV